GGVAQAPVQAQLAQEYGMVEVGVDLVGGGHDAKRDGQIVGGAFLAQVGWGEVDDDAGRAGHGAARVADGGAHALLGLVDGGLGQAHDLDEGEGRPADVNLHLYEGAFQADYGATEYPGQCHRDLSDIGREK